MWNWKNNNGKRSASKVGLFNLYILFNIYYKNLYKDRELIVSQRSLFVIIY